MVESFAILTEGAIVVNLCMWEDSDETILGGVSGREQTLIRMYSKDTGVEIVPINISSYTSDLYVPGIGNVSEVYREGIREDYDMSTPSFYDEDMEEKLLYWTNVKMICEENPGRDLFYTVIDRDNPFDRRLVKYEVETESIASGDSSDGGNTGRTRGGF